METPSDRIERSIVTFMRRVPVHVTPILYRTEYRGRAFPDSEIMVMMALNAVSPQSPSQISRMLGMQKGSLTSVLRRLERAGFIRRRANPGDDRSYVLVMTVEGEAFVAHLERQRQEGFRRAFGNMEPEDIALAVRGLDLIAAHLKKLEETKMTERTTHESAHQNWYQAASPEDRREYDLFGPWINEVKSEEDMPKRFRQYYAGCKDARFLLKIPRDADRRNVRPGMDLYVAVVAVQEEGVSLIRLEDGRVEKTDLTWDRIAAVGSYTDKLLGVWTLYLKDGARPGFRYNKVSSELIDAATDFVREKAIGSRGTLQERPGPQIELTDDDLFFGSSLLELRKRGPEPMVPIHFEPQDRPCRNDEGDPALSTGVMFLEAADELIIINRDKPARNRDEAWHAANDIFIPYASITGYSLGAPNEESQGQFLRLVLHMDKQRLVQPCLKIPDAIIETLRARGVAAS